MVNKDSWLWVKARTSDPGWGQNKGLLFRQANQQSVIGIHRWVWPPNLTSGSLLFLFMCAFVYVCVCDVLATTFNFRAWMVGRLRTELNLPQDTRFQHFPSTAHPRPPPPPFLSTSPPGGHQEANPAHDGSKQFLFCVLFLGGRCFHVAPDCIWH